MSHIAATTHSRSSWIHRLVGSPWLWGGLALAGFLLLPHVGSGWRSLCRLLVVGGMLYGLGSLVRWLWNLRPGARLGFVLFAAVNYVALEAASWVATKTVLRSPGVEARLSLSDNDRKALQLLVNDPDFLGLELHPVLGWTHRPNAPHRPTNNLGLRNSKPVAPEPLPGSLRVACMGDSFTFGSEVDVGDTWPHLAQELLEDSEFLNFGLPGTGVTQSLLRFEHEASVLRPQVVIIGFLRQNFFRAVNVYRPFLRPGSGPPIPQPYAAIERDQLVIHPPHFKSLEAIPEFLANPQPVLAELYQRDYLMQNFGGSTAGTPLWRLGSRLAAQDGVRESVNILVKRRWLDPKPDFRDLENSALDTDPHLFEINRRLMARYVQSVREAGAVPIVLIYAGKLDVLHFNKGRPLLYHSYQEMLTNAGVEVIEVMDILAANLGRPMEISAIFKVGHYNEAINKLIAQAVVDRLRKMQPPRAP